MIEQAIKLAMSNHEGQVDKAGEPYILHPLRVMLDVHAQGAPEYVVVAAMLHDLVEDTDVGHALIFDLFGGRVADLVAVLTRAADEDYSHYIGRVATDADARQVKLADLEDNLLKRREESLPSSLGERYSRAKVELILASVPTVEGKKENT